MNYHINNLKEYIKRDEIYQKFKRGESQELSDFDIFCIEHCKDIEAVLTIFNKIENELKEGRPKDHLWLMGYYDACKDLKNLLKEVE